MKILSRIEKGAARLGKGEKKTMDRRDETFYHFILNWVHDPGAILKKIKHKIRAF